MTADIKQMELVLAKLRVSLKDNFEVAVRESADKAVELAANDIIKTFDFEFSQKVREFYDEYNPKFYTRRYGLYDVMEIKEGESKNGKKTYSLVYNADSIPTRNGGDALLDTVFMEGYHGGAYSRKPDIFMNTVGTPHYRGPLPTKGVSSWIWWTNAAVQTEAPIDKWHERLTEISNSDRFQKTFTSYFSELISKRLKNLV